MNPRWEWAVPLAFALVFGVGAWLLMEGSDGEPTEGVGDDSPSTSAAPGPSHVLLPFDEGRALDGRNLTYLVLAPHGKAAANAELNESGPSYAQSLAWQGEHVAFYATSVHACPQPPPGTMASCDPPWAFGPWPLPRSYGLPSETRPVLFHDGHNATRVTAYVFDEDGLLVASNANDTARFEQHDDFFRLPSTAWYLGANETAPNGTAHLPAGARPLVERVRSQLDGLPVGGVATTRSNAYVALYGSLFVTLRIDELVHAP